MGSGSTSRQVQQRYQCVREGQSLEVGRAPKAGVQEVLPGVLLLLLPGVKSLRWSSLAQFSDSVLPVRKLSCP